MIALLILLVQSIASTNNNEPNIINPLISSINTYFVKNLQKDSSGGGDEIVDMPCIDLYIQVTVYDPFGSKSELEFEYSFNGHFDNVVNSLKEHFSEFLGSVYDGNVISHNLVSCEKPLLYVVLKSDRKIVVGDVVSNVSLIVAEMPKDGENEAEQIIHDVRKGDINSNN